MQEINKQAVYNENSMALLPDHYTERYKHNEMWIYNLASKIQPWYSADILQRECASI